MEKELEPRLNEAKEGKRKVFFVDATHFVCGAFLGYLWSKVRLFVPTMSGRNRYNVLGAIDAITHDLFFVSNETYINSLSVCDLLNQIYANCKDTLITIVLDNARYQHCNYVKQIAESLNIELLFLPSYSPNLNLIERLWKWMKEDCLNCQYHENFKQFKEKINKSLQDTVNHKNKDKLDTLLTLKFQLYDNSIYNRA